MARVLIVSPHADDEVVGCGGMIAKRKDDVFDLVVAAIGNPNPGVQTVIGWRTDELAESCKILGIVSWTVLYHNLSGYLDRVPMFELVGKLDRILQGNQYDEVYYPASPVHMHDHSIVNRACWAALRPGAHNPHPTLIAMYEHTWPGWSPITVNLGRMYVDISEVMPTKLAAMSCYQSQLERHEEHLHHPISLNGIMSLGVARGLEACCKYAELYYIMQMRR